MWKKVIDACGHTRHVSRQTSSMAGEVIYGEDVIYGGKVIYAIDVIYA
jgi:hypothetical protein